MEDFLLPDEIVLKIFSYLGLGELIQCSKVSRRFNMICKDKSLGYRSSMLIMKDLTVEDQKYLNKILIARPELTKVEIHSISWEQWEGGDEKRLSKAMASRKFLGPKRKRLEKKGKFLKALGASVCANDFKYHWWSLLVERYPIPSDLWLVRSTKSHVFVSALSEFGVSHFITFAESRMVLRVLAFCKRSSDIENDSLPTYSLNEEQEDVLDIAPCPLHGCCVPYDSMRLQIKHCRNPGTQYAVLQ